MDQYATLSFKISGAKDETHLSDNLFRGPQAQSDILGNYNENTGNNNTFGSFNTTIVLPSATDSGVRNRRSVFVAGEAGIIRIPERYLATN